jgi:hypothetical protein
MLVLHHWLREDAGAPQLYQLAVSSYEKCLALLPKDALWHYGFAQLLYFHSRMGGFDRYNPDLSEVVRALKEAKTSLELDPKNQDTYYLISYIMWDYPGTVSKKDGEYDYLALTAIPQYTAEPTDFPIILSTDEPTAAVEPGSTPTAAVTASPTASQDPTDAVPTTPVPTNTIAVEPTIGAQSVQAEARPGNSNAKPGFPVCGAGLVLPLMICLGAAVRFRRSG